MAYRPSSHPPETAWARHLDRIRRERDWSATQMFEAVRDPLGLGEKSRSAFTSRLHKDPKAAYIPTLRELFGEPDEPQPARVETPDLATAVLALATALPALVAELAAHREERTVLRAQVDELRATVELLVERTPLGRGTGGQAGHGVPPAAAGSAL